MDASSLLLAASWRGFFSGLFVVLFILVCILLMGVILLQKGRGGGLSSAFGGAMGSSPFGAKTGDVFTWITVVLAAVFLIAAVVLNKIYLPAEAKDNPAATATQTPGEGGLPVPAENTPIPSGQGNEAIIPIPSEGGTEGGSTAAPPAGGGSESNAPTPPAEGGETGGGDADPGPGDTDN